MPNQPWQGDACSLVDAYRRGDHSPLEELEATLEAIAESQLNAFCFLDEAGARQVARNSDVSLPFGGVPVAVKELDSVRGWPDTDASVPFAERVAHRDSTQIARLRGGGAVLVGLTTASEFGGVNYTRTKLHGITRNPWNPERTPGGSSGGTAAAVAGGLITIGTAGDGGGSIRIPAGFTGMFGLKCSYGRIPKGPDSIVGNLTGVVGCISRSVRDTARWLDVCSGYDRHDPYSLPRVDGWEARLGRSELRGLRVAYIPDFGGAVVHSDVAKTVATSAERLIDAAGLERVEIGSPRLPNLGADWSLTGSIGVRASLGDLWPDCAGDLTPQIAFSLRAAEERINLRRAARAEVRRREFNEAMAAIFDEVDLVMTPTNPDVAFDAAGPMPSEVEGESVGTGNNGALTIPSNVYGNPAVSIPAGMSREMPVGLQVLAAHHREALLLDLALVAESEMPWPLRAPGAPV